MSSKTDPKKIDAALKHAHQIRSEMVFDTMKRGSRHLSELFTLYNPQKRFRR
jgi:hypothetical protein